jgi:hypothetical protein
MKILPAGNCKNSIYGQFCFCHFSASENEKPGTLPGLSIYFYPYRINAIFPK